MRKLILYTDGSFKHNDNTPEPNIGIYGSGAHGYVFEDVETKAISDAPNNYYITREGYVPSNLYNKDEDKLVTPLYYIDGAYSFLNRGTANRAELLAIKCSLDGVVNNNEELALNKIKIYSDSTYAIGVINKIIVAPDYLKSVPDAPNIDILLDLQEAIAKCNVCNIEIEITKVDAHTIHIGNNIADDLAYHARQQSGNYNLINIFNVFKIDKGKKYWSYSIEENELLKFKQLVFTNTINANGTELLYSVMNYKTDVEIGSRTHDLLLGLVSVKETPTIIDDAIKTYHEGLKSMCLLSVVNLRNLYSRDITYKYSIFGKNLFDFFFRDKELCVRKLPIITAYYPPGLGNKLLLDMQFMYEYIRIYKNNKSIIERDNLVVVNKVIAYCNITDMVYSVNNKKKVTCSIPSSTTYLPIKLDVFDKQLDFPLVLSKDTLDRNQLKRLESRNPKVYIILEKMADKSYRYFTLIEATDDIGVYGNLYANKIIIE